MCYKTGMQIHPVFFLFVAAVTSACQTSVKSSTTCILPPYPNNGRYEVAGDPAAKPGDKLEYVYLNVSCNQGHSVVGNNVALCILGEWSTSLPQCVRTCYIQEHPSVTYSCNMPGAQWFGACGEYQPLETSVQPKCRPGYYSEVDMPLMRCIDGAWTNMPKCVPECGRVPGNGSTSPWSVLIYTNSTSDNTTVEQICIGNIISANIIITAAHCFWQHVLSTKVDKTKFRVVVGTNKFRETASSDKFSVKDVKIPERYQGLANHYQHDIALVILSRAFTFTTELQPVCLDFDPIFNEKQLQEGNLGTVAVLPYPGGKEQQKELTVQRIPYIPFQKCIQKSPPYFIEYITGDKFCAGRDNGTLICNGNSGTGLTFLENQLGVDRHFLRGLVSMSSLTGPECALTDFTLFTEINSYKNFIQENLATSLPPRVENPGVLDLWKAYEESKPTRTGPLNAFNGTWYQPAIIPVCYASASKDNPPLMRNYCDIWKTKI